MKKAFFTLLLIPTLNIASVRDLSGSQMYEVVRLARLIAYAQPNLNSTKYFEYAFGVLTASQTYGVDPLLLIAIAHQETSFRENLPEGAAGEIGMLQIRKNWLRNPLFIRQFGELKIKDLKNPVKSFTFAAWILKDLKTFETPSRTLPYWSYYNSRSFENRLRYFVAVNRYIVKLRRAAPAIADRSLASVQSLSRSNLRKRALAKAKVFVPWQATLD
jgi:soluble lytic murein transglycosylase-like protein